MKIIRMMRVMVGMKKTTHMLPGPPPPKKETYLLVNLCDTQSRSCTHNSTCAPVFPACDSSRAADVSAFSKARSAARQHIWTDLLCVIRRCARIALILRR